LLRPAFVVMVRVMMRLSSTGDLVAAIRAARSVTLLSYTLAPGRVLDALRQAAAAGARVRVRLEGYVYKDDGSIGSVNRAAIAALRKAGADASFVHATQDAKDAMLHAKAAVVDDALYLDDRNWPDDGADTILRDDFPCDAAMVRDAVRGREDEPNAFFAIAKRAALASEARLLASAGRGDDVIVESESFGSGNRVYAQVDRLALAGAHVRLLVNARDLHGASKEQAALARLRHDGVEVRVTDSDEKFATVNGKRGWVGSANATVAFDHPDQLDWGVRTDTLEVLAHLGRTFNERWVTASRVVP
jgi:phosphatidylserine/phosphatidylglycerophosphate/cardiolipin synthase-like enzyme